MLGMLGGFCIPCATPVLVMLLAMVAQGGSLLWGVLVPYSLALRAAACRRHVGRSANGLASSARLGRLGRVFKIAMGGAILLLSFYMFYLGF